MRQYQQCARSIRGWRGCTPKSPSHTCLRSTCTHIPTACQHSAAVVQIMCGDRALQSSRQNPRDPWNSESVCRITRLLQTAAVEAQPDAQPAARQRAMLRPRTHLHTHRPFLCHSGGDMAVEGTWPVVGRGRIPRVVRSQDRPPSALSLWAMHLSRGTPTPGMWMPTLPPCLSVGKSQCTRPSLDLCLDMCSQSDYF